MGWTHHWYRETELDEHAFAAAVRDCRTAMAKIDVALAGFDGTGKPLFQPDHIVFNGRSPATCEPFEISRVEFDRRGRPEAFGFCKTEHLPYDVCVQAALVIFKHHLGLAFRVGSDGCEDDWVPAIDLVRTCLGCGDGFRLDDSDD